MLPRLRPFRLLARVALVVTVGVAAAGVAAAGSAIAQPRTTPASWTTQTPDPRGATRAMWVWDTSTPAATVDVATGVGQLYAAVPPHLDTSPQLAQLTELSQRARAAGLRIDALGGDPGWVDNQAWVVDSWLRPALSSGLFTGVHVDIEPYTTPAWDSQRAKVVKKYLATYDTLVAAAGGATVDADIPFWFDTIAVSGGSTLDREVIRRTSGVTVMAYRNIAAGSDGTVALAANEVAAGDALGKPVRIGQETTWLGSDPTATKQTFYGQTRSAMEVQLQAVTTAFAGHPSFAGLAIHDAAGYAAMAP
jgi:hypothetical protein